jgi:hypothetical protein
LEIGQNSEDWKEAMDKFVSAKMYNERLLDFVAQASTAPVTFTLENSLCAYFKCKSLQRNEYYQLGEAKSTKKGSTSVRELHYQREKKKRQN